MARRRKRRRRGSGRPLLNWEDALVDITLADGLLRGNGEEARQEPTCAAEVGAEITAPETSANHSPVQQPVGNADSRRKIGTRARLIPDDYKVSSKLTLCSARRRA